MLDVAPVTFIHGVCNKPVSDVLHHIWVRTLAQSDGIDPIAEGVTPLNGRRRLRKSRFRRAREVRRQERDLDPVHS